MTPKRFSAQLVKLLAKQAKVRDELRDLVEEGESALSDNDDAHEAISEAIDALSRLA